MKPFTPLHKRLRVCGFTAACSLMALPLFALTVAPRISSVSSSETTRLKGSLHPLAQPQFETGRMQADTRLTGISIVFNRTAAQQAALNTLIAEQQNPASPLYHQWLTPDQFAARFGMAPSDLQKVQSWLEQQGFSIDSVSRSRNVIRFSGTVRQVEAAFQTEMHTYNIKGVPHFAPSTELSVPSGIAPTVLAIRNLNDFRPKAQVVYRKNLRPRPQFTSGQTGDVFFAPGDIATAYNIKGVYSAGYTGSGQKIAIVGQSSIVISDIENFQNAAGLTVKDPTLVLMPNTGTPESFQGDESESDLDLEWSGAIATGADIYFVYTGSNTNYGAFDAIQYAVDQDIAPIISSSYGECEAYLDGSTLESTFQQATSQGQTLLAASGDDGSTDCYISDSTTSGNPPQSQQQALAVDYPASSPYVTGMGGTEVSQANANYLTSGTAYWEGSSNGNDVISSALQYLPEVAWNDDTANCGQDNCLAASGGGASTLFTKPSWQTGVPGIPSDGKRDVPDLALYASPSFPGYLYCTSDTSAWDSQDGQVASCNSGFRDSSTGLLTVAGGTSFAAPIFAGVVALINQKADYTSGQGLINPTLYKLASDSTTYSSAFHDITTGNNDCTAGSPYCSSTAGFSAGTGYDQVTGLGSIDAYNLVNAWPANTQTTLIATTTTISAASTTPAINASDIFTISVTSNTGSTIPTGTISLTIDGGTPITGIALTANGTATYTTSFTTAGSHQLVAKYSGDSTHASSTGVITVTVPTTSSGAGSFTLAATNLSVAQGASGASTITVTPKNGYTGTVDLTFDTSNDNSLQNLCWQFTNMNTSGDGTVTVSSASAVSTQLTLDTNASDCVSSGFAVRKGRMKPLSVLHGLRASGNKIPSDSNPHRAPAAFAFAGLLLAGFVGRYSRKLRSLAGVIALAAVGLGISACGGISSSLSNPPVGTYTITVTGQDSSSATIPTATTTFTFTIQ
jgi:subtilase family serine protease